jgi:multidrug efflux pump subunit AcrA (membrane-fusion protein)
MMRAIAIASIFASLLLFTAGCKRETEASEPIRPVLSTTVEGKASSSTAAVGTLEPRFKTELSFRLLGRLIASPVNVGFG